MKAIDLPELFPVLHDKLREEFERVAERMTFAKGEQLYEEGFPCPFVPFIVSGVVRVFKIGESGREITLYRVWPGQLCVLSSTCSVSDLQYPAIAEAEEDAVVYVVPGAAFRRMLHHSPELQELIFNLMSERLVELMRVVEEVAFQRVDLRLATRLLHETEPPRPAVVSATHAHLAIELGTAREVISRILKDFERRGMLRLVRGKIEVLDRPKLAQLHEELRREAG